MQSSALRLPLYYLLIASSTCFGAGSYDQTLILHIQEYPKPLKKATPESLKSALESCNLPSKILQNFCPKTNRGIMATYRGFMAVSNRDGLITFPRGQQAARFTLLITQHVKPIFMIGNTIHHWEIIPGVPAAFYSIERKQDRQTKLWYWSVEPKELPTNTIIQLDTITLIAKPNKVVVPTGITLTTNSSQFVLPTIYVQPMNNAINALNALNMRTFFGPINTLKKQVSPTYFSSHIMP